MIANDLKNAEKRKQNIERERKKKFDEIHESREIERENLFLLS